MLILTTVALLTLSTVTPEDTCSVEMFAVPASVEPDSSCTFAFSGDSCSEFK